MNVSKPSFIRVEADELTYDFHIMLRVEIEVATATLRCPAPGCAALCCRIAVLLQPVFRRAQQPRYQSEP